MTLPKPKTAAAVTAIATTVRKVTSANHPEKSARAKKAASRGKTSKKSSSTERQRPGKRSEKHKGKKSSERFGSLRLAGDVLFKSPKCEVRKAYTASSSGELSLQVGDEVFLLQMPNDDAMWRGRTAEGKTGMFPADHVELTDDHSGDSSLDDDRLFADLVNAVSPATPQSDSNKDLHLNAVSSATPQSDSNRDLHALNKALKGLQGGGDKAELGSGAYDGIVDVSPVVSGEKKSSPRRSPPSPQSSASPSTSDQSVSVESSPRSQAKSEETPEERVKLLQLALDASRDEIAKLQDEKRKGTEQASRAAEALQEIKEELVEAREELKRRDERDLQVAEVILGLKRRVEELEGKE